MYECAVNVWKSYSVIECCISHKACKLVLALPILVLDQLIPICSNSLANAAGVPPHYNAKKNIGGAQ